MASLFVETPWAAQCAVVFLFGAVLAAAANYCVDRFAWTPRFRSPWRRFPTEFDVAPSRNWADRVPIWGWLALSRFAWSDGDSNGKKNEKTNGKTNGGAPFRFAAIPGWESRWFWIRPFLAEIAFAAFLCWRFAEVVGDAAPAELANALVGWGAETILFWLALCASLVDFDDYIIPDELVVPGALVGLTIAALFPFATYYPIRWPLDSTGLASTTDVFLFAGRVCSLWGRVATPENARFLVFGGLTALWSFWIAALFDRRWYGRLGWRRAAAIFWRRLRRAPSTPILGIVWALGALGIAALVRLDVGASLVGTVDSSVENVGFIGVPLSSAGALANALVGLFVGTALIWAVRLVGGGALGVEAMGFGDVVLLGAIGAFVGWEGVVVVFFIAPFFGLVFGLLRRFFDSAPEIPYGPFLCLGTVVYVVGRERFHSLLAPFFNDPLFVAAIGLVGFALLAAMLFALRLFKSRARRYTTDR